MTDPLDDLRHALKNATPAPDAARRTANLACAQEVFNRAQEMAAEQRPTRDRPDAWAGIKHGVGKLLATLAARPALTAATAFAALGLVVLVPALRDRIPPLPTPFGASTDTAIEGLQVPIEGLHETAEEIAQLPEFHAAESVSGLRHPPAPQVAPMQSAPARIAASESVSAIPRSPGDEGGGMFGAIVGGQAATRAKYREEFTVAREDIAFGFEAPGAVVFANKDPNPLKIVAEEPVSTFSIDVDTASYSVNSLVPDARLPAIGRRRAHRGDDQLLSLCLSRTRGRRGALQTHDYRCADPLEPAHAIDSHRAPGPAAGHRGPSAAESRLPHRYIWLHGRTRQASAARPVVSPDAQPAAP